MNIEAVVEVDVVGDETKAPVEEAEQQTTIERAMDVAQRGMTLIEIMVVMAIIGLIGTVIAVSVSGTGDQARKDGAGMLVKNVGGQVQMYEMSRHEYPDSLEALVEAKRLKKDQLIDPWNKALSFSVSDSGFTVCSGGPDKVAGNSDDICFDSNEE